MLAKQRSSVPLTPAEAARQRKSRRDQESPVPAGAAAPHDPPPAQEKLAQEQQAAQEQPARPGALGRPVGTVAAAASRAQRAVPVPLRRAWSRVAGHRGALLAAACAIAVPLAYLLAASRLRKQGSPALPPYLRFRGRR